MEFSSIFLFDWMMSKCLKTGMFLQLELFGVLVSFEGVVFVLYLCLCLLIFMNHQQ